jgi:hypothetical protein
LSPMPSTRLREPEGTVALPWLTTFSSDSDEARRIRQHGRAFSSLTAIAQHLPSLAGFAFVSNGRMLAKVGDLEMPAYELWFSFESDGDKQKFFELVRADGYANPEDEGEFEPAGPECLADLKRLRPWGQVFLEADVERITMMMTLTLVTMGVDIDNSETPTRPN